MSTSPDPKAFREIAESMRREAEKYREPQLDMNERLIKLKEHGVVASWGGWYLLSRVEKKVWLTFDAPNGPPARGEPWPETHGCKAEFLLHSEKVLQPYSHAEGVQMICEKLGFNSAKDLSHWASAEWEIWGNDFGALAPFCIQGFAREAILPNAYFDHRRWIEKVCVHLERVAERIENKRGGILYYGRGEYDGPTG